MLKLQLRFGYQTERFCAPAKALEAGQADLDHEGVARGTWSAESQAHQGCQGTEVLQPGHELRRARARAFRRRTARGLGPLARIQPRR